MSSSEPGWDVTLRPHLTPYFAYGAAFVIAAAHITVGFLLKIGSTGVVFQTADQVAMAAQILGGRVDDDVRAQGQRPGQDGRGVGVVDHHLGPGAMRDAGDGGDVDQTHVRIGRGLKIDDPSLLGDRLRQRLWTGHVDLLHRHAEAGQAVT